MRIGKMSKRPSTGQRGAEEIARSWSSGRPRWAWGQKASTSTVVTSGKVKLSGFFFGKVILGQRAWREKNYLVSKDNHHLAGIWLAPHQQPVKTISHKTSWSSPGLPSRMRSRDGLTNGTPKFCPQRSSSCPPKLNWQLSKAHLHSGSSGCAVRSFSWGCQDGSQQVGLLPRSWLEPAGLWTQFYEIFCRDESWEFAPIFRQDQLAENCPVSVQADLRQLYSSVCELIRSPYRVHIWIGDFLTVYITGISGMPSLPPPQSWLRKPRKCLRRFKSFNLSRSGRLRRRLSAGEVLNNLGRGVYFPNSGEIYTPGPN